MNTNQKLALGLTSLGAILALAKMRQKSTNLAGQTVLITGGSSGLGLLLAREFAREGCRLVICARGEAKLEQARLALREIGAEVLAIPCDVSDRVQVYELVKQATRAFGQIDILVNNAGVIQVSPVENVKLADFEQAMDIMFWGVLYPIMAVLPQMQERRSGRIVNITSIGGKVSVPHLLPYASAKFATVGLSEGLRAELAKDGITVTTIAPGLMRTGSYLNALFKGKQNEEYTWFTLGASLPFISMNAEEAARQIVQATKQGEAERILSIPANLLARFHGLFPGVTSDLLGIVSSLLLPYGQSTDGSTIEGRAVQAELSPARKQLLDFLTVLGRQAAQQFQPYPE